MPLSIDLFSQGQLTNTQGVLYKPDSGQAASIKVTLVNTAGNTIKVNLYLKKGSDTARRITPKDLELGAQHRYTTCYHELGEGDSVEGKAAAGSLVDYTINGVLKSG